MLNLVLPFYFRSPAAGGAEPGGEVPGSRVSCPRRAEDAIVGATLVVAHVMAPTSTNDFAGPFR